MSTALSLESQKLAMELHSVLSELDPARWKESNASLLRQRLGAVEAQAANLARSAANVDRDTANDRDAANVRRDAANVGRDAANVRRDAANVGSDAANAEGSAATRNERRVLHGDPPAATRLRDGLFDLREALRQAPGDEDSSGTMTERWMAFRQTMIPHYEAIQDGLRDYAIHVPSLRPTNHARNVFHVASALGCMAILEALPNMTWAMAITVPIAVWAWSMELLRPTRPRLNAFFMGLFGRLAHPHEHTRVNSATWYITALAALALFTTKETAALGLVVLGLGDPTAALIGRRFGRIRLIHGRTLEGTLAFVIVAAAGGVAVLRLLHPD
ncbi:MAG: hypothetical protein AAGF12_43775, partial [Myxococcota bacterium]